MSLNNYGCVSRTHAVILPRWATLHGWKVLLRWLFTNLLSNHRWCQPSGSLEQPLLPPPSQGINSAVGFVTACLPQTPLSSGDKSGARGILLGQAQHPSRRVQGHMAYVRCHRPHMTQQASIHPTVCTRTYCILSSVLTTQDDPEEPAAGRSRSPREARERGGAPCRSRAWQARGAPSPETIAVATRGRAHPLRAPPEGPSGSSQRDHSPRLPRGKLEPRGPLGCGTA